MKKNYQKTKYQLNPKINEQYKKRYLENPELHKKIKKSSIINVKKRKNVAIRLRTFSTSKTRPLLYLHNMSSKPDKHSVRFLNTQNIKLSLRSCIIQWNHLMKNCTYVQHVKSTFTKIQFHFKQSAIKWL